jgi:hypothetical protein
MLGQVTSTWIYRELWLEYGDGMSFITYYLKKAWDWFEFSTPKADKDLPTSTPKADITAEEGKRILRSELVRRAEKGWKIEIENDTDAVVSKKGSIAWILHIFIILILLVVFPLLAFFWLIIMVILAVTKKPRTMRIWVEKDGSLFSR